MASVAIVLSRAADVLILLTIIVYAGLVITGFDEVVPVPPAFQVFSSKPMVPVVPFKVANIDSIQTLFRPVGAGLAAYSNVMCGLAVTGLLALCSKVHRSGLGAEKKKELLNFVFFWAIGGFGVIWSFKNIVDEEWPQDWNALLLLTAVFHVGYECVVAPCIVLRCFPSGRIMSAGLVLAAIVTMAAVQIGLVSFTRATAALTIVTFTAHSCGKLAISTLDMTSQSNRLAMLMWWGHAAPELLSCVFECSLFLEITLHFFVVAPALLWYVHIALEGDFCGDQVSERSCRRKSSLCRVTLASPSSSKKRQ